jgi:hypothetical protein
MPEALPGARRPHPVADVPPAALADGQAPAKGWLLALVAARPLQDAPALPMPGPRARPRAAAILRGGLDADLRRLQDGGDRAAGGPGGRAAGAVAGGDRGRRGSATRCIRQALTLAMAPLGAATTAALAERPPRVRCGHRRDAEPRRRPGRRRRELPGTSRAATGGAVERLTAEGLAFALLAVEADDVVGGRGRRRRDRRPRASSRPSAASCAPRRLGREDDGVDRAAELGAPGARPWPSACRRGSPAAPPRRPAERLDRLAASPADGAIARRWWRATTKSPERGAAAGAPLGLAPSGLVVRAAPPNASRRPNGRSAD